MASGRGNRAIARELERRPKTVDQEISRNSFALPGTVSSHLRCPCSYGVGDSFGLSSSGFSTIGFGLMRIFAPASSAAFSASAGS